MSDGEGARPPDARATPGARTAAAAETRSSALLRSHGFLHAFSTRRGGASAAPFDTLNFGRAVGDDAAAVAENHARLARSVGYAVERLFETSQVHGVGVHVLEAGASVELTRKLEADALLARTSGDAVGVRTADCVPVLVGDPETGAALAVHAGWRGVAARIVPLAIARMVEVTGAPAVRLVCAIGPHIRARAFEVGDDVAAQIAASSEPGVVVRAPDQRPHVDLARAVRVQLAEIGVENGRIDDVGGCAHDEPGLYFSFRRDGARSGRMLSVIVAR